MASDSLSVFGQLLRHVESGKRRRRRRRGIAPPRDGEMALFLSRWLRAPHRIGAVAPASRYLARAMARLVDSSRAEPVIELGGGTGSVTKALLESGVPVERLVVVERDERLCHALRRRFPQLRILQGDATQLVTLLRPLGIEHASAVVSSLPLISMSRRAKRDIIEQSFALLGETGRLIQYTYSLASPVPPRQFGLRARVAARIWLNVPPASVWSYRRSVRPARSRE